MLHAIDKHRRTFLWGAPITLALFVSVGTSALEGNALSATASSTRFVEVGSTFDVAITIGAEDPVNVAAGIVTYPPDRVQVISVTSENSAVDLWAEAPFYSNDLGVVTFAGGFVHRDGFSGTGTIATIHFEARATGDAPIAITSPALLAHDGKGTNIVTHTNETAIIVRAKGQANPDINGDGHVTITDVNAMYLTILRPYNARFDIDGNGRVNLRDIAHLFSLFGR